MSITDYDSGSINLQSNGPLAWMTLAIAGGALFLFRRAAHTAPAFPQFGMIAGGLMLVFLTLVVEPLGWFFIVLLGLGLFIAHAIMNDPEPGAFYQQTVYQGGVVLLFVLHIFDGEQNLVASSLFLLLALMLWGLIRFITRHHEIDPQPADDWRRVESINSENGEDLPPIQ